MRRMDRPPIRIDPLSFWLNQSQGGMSGWKLGKPLSLPRPARVALRVSVAPFFPVDQLPRRQWRHIADMANKIDTALDLFYLLPDQRILACRACKAGVVPKHLVTHIRAHHRRLYPEFETRRSTTEWVKNRLLTSLPCELLDAFAADLVHKRIVSVSLLTWIRFGLPSCFQLRNSG